jgi:hypothetical protein
MHREQLSKQHRPPFFQEKRDLRKPAGIPFQDNAARAEAASHPSFGQIV